MGTRIWKLGGQATLLLLSLINAALAQEEREVRGRVVDERGRPVAEASVASFWNANGSDKDQNGIPLDLSKPEVRKEHWGHVGKMEPTDFGVCKTGTDGQFSAKMLVISHTVMAMDAARVRGGLGVLTKGKEDSPLEIRLVPLVRVRGSFSGAQAGSRPDWTYVYTMLPDDPTRPLDFTRLVSCGSNEARFEMALPPGRYVLDGYSKARDAELVPNKEIVLTGATPEVDLGVLLLTKKLSIGTRKERSKAEGTWGDCTKHYGERPPQWHATDARGVAKSVQASDFKGKWVLLDFWGPSCSVCLRSGLPRLMRFYEEHTAQRDQFEILSICIDPDGQLKSMADLDQALQPIIEHVWNGQTIPFPILLDPTFETWESFGLRGLGQVELIDPDGNLLQGDEKVLAQKLKE